MFFTQLSNPCQEIMESEGVGEVLFFFRNIKEGKKWISALLDEDPDFDSEGYCSFRLGNTTIGLHPSDSKSGQGSSGQVAYWKVPDLRKAIDHFIRNGCHIYRGPIIGADGAKVCQMKDPFDNLWGLVETR